MHSIFRAAPLIAVAVLAGIVAACTATDPRLGDGPTPTGAPTAAPTSAPTPSTTTTPGPIGSAHVTLDVATAHTVTVDVTDASSTLVGAASGTPGDGASVEVYTVAVTNVSPTTLRLTWVGGPCDSANLLSIDATGHRFVVVQPECHGDAIVMDRVLDLDFAAPIKASDVEAFLQDGLDT